MLEPMRASQIIDLFQTAKRDSDFAIIEGVQALKHALRFEAEIEYIVSIDKDELRQLLKELAPDVINKIDSKLLIVDPETFKKLSPKNHRTKVTTLAKRRRYTLETINQKKPIVFLEDPKDLENIGAVIRVAAAADAGAVVIDSAVDIWHPSIIRGAAGLHYAVPVFNNSLNQIKNSREVISLDPSGEDIQKQNVLKNTVLIFGTERYGIKKSSLQESDKILRLNMKPGVSSLNLATSVAATLYLL